MSPQVTAPNERTRIYLSLALLDGNVSVTDQVEKYGKPFDISKRGGEFYTDKAPGSSVIALPFIAGYQLLGGGDSMEKLNVFVRRWVMVPFALLSFLLVRVISLSSGASRQSANIASIFFAIGTSFFHYGSAFYGHALVTFFSLLAAWAVIKSLDAEDQRWRSAWQFSAGFAGACAFAVEYQAVVICVALAMGFLTVRAHRRIRAILAPLLGASVPIGLTLLYNNAAFGGFLKTGYAHLPHAASRQNHVEGIYGVSLPSLEGLYGLLFTPSRGLLLCAPIVLLGFFGLAHLWRRCRWLAVYAAISMVGLLFLMGGADAWFGGWAFGPRLLVPIFGLAAISAAITLDAIENRWPSLLAAVIGWLVAGVLYNVFVSTMFPELPPSVTAPLRMVAMPLAEMGAPSPNIGMVWLGLSGLWSLVPLALIVVGLLVYAIWPLRPRGVATLQASAFFVLAVVLSGIFAYGYPGDDARGEKFAERRATYRIHPE